MNEERRKLDINAERQADATVVRLAGEIDLRSSPELRGTFLDLIEEKPARIIVDLTSVNHIDSSGIGTIVELKRRAGGEQNAIVLVGLQPRVRSLFEITRLDKFFTITDTIDEARQA